VFHVIGDGINTCSFSAGRTRGSFSTNRFIDLSNMKPVQSTTDLGSNIRSLQGISDSAWSFSSSFVSAVGGTSSSFPIAAINPNKAVFTIDKKSLKVKYLHTPTSTVSGYAVLDFLGFS